ncbi:MAG TPA: hypothetical protein VM118_08665 [Acidobacteriota bacterium]|nr:hypothetical protein [Acidobacteriota bacterium]
MDTRRYRSLSRDRKEKQKPRADQGTLWVLIVVIVATVIALTFDDAQGAMTLLTTAGFGL